jgi:hypothetical protein
VGATSGVTDTFISSADFAEHSRGFAQFTQASHDGFGIGRGDVHRHADTAVEGAVHLSVVHACRLLQVDSI